MRTESRNVQRRDQRTFALTFALAVAMLGAIRWALYRHGMPIEFFVAALALAAVGLAVPRAIAPVMRAWEQVARGMNWVLTRLLLTLAFVFMIIPARVLIRFFGRDPLKRAWDPFAATYWEDAEEQPTDIRSYYNQF